MSTNHNSRLIPFKLYYLSITHQKIILQGSKKKNYQNYIMINGTHLFNSHKIVQFYRLTSQVGRGLYVWCLASKRCLKILLLGSVIKFYWLLASRAFFLEHMSTKKKLASWVPPINLPLNRYTLKDRKKNIFR